MTDWPRRRRAVLRDAVGVGVATGAYGLSFGAIGVAGGLTVAQTCATSVLMFTGASQFALVGVLAAGGGPASAAVTAVLLGARNARYGLRLSSLLQRSLYAKGIDLSTPRIFELLGGIRETLVIYPRKQGQHQHPTQTSLSTISTEQQELLDALNLKRFLKV